MDASVDANARTNADDDDDDDDIDDDDGGGKSTCFLILEVIHPFACVQPPCFFLFGNFSVCHRTEEWGKHL